MSMRLENGLHSALKCCTILILKHLGEDQNDGMGDNNSFEEDEGLSYDDFVRRLSALVFKYDNPWNEYLKTHIPQLDLNLAGVVSHGSVLANVTYKQPKARKNLEKFGFTEVFVAESTRYNTKVWTCMITAEDFLKKLREEETRLGIKYEDMTKRVN